MLVIEDGSIVAGADSYVTVLEYQTYAAARGWVTGEDDAADEVVLRRAFDAINRNWQYRGATMAADQAGAWPRTIEAGIPQRVKYAQSEMAHLIQGGADPMATITGTASRVKAKAGPVETETEYLGGLASARYTAVDGLLRPYLLAGAGQIQLMRG